jgi:hypothetical protein
MGIIMAVLIKHSFLSACPFSISKKIKLSVGLVTFVYPKMK